MSFIINNGDQDPAILINDAWVCVRPSGTEPKVKFYYGVKGTSLADADEKSAVMGKAVLDMVDSMM